MTCGGHQCDLCELLLLVTGHGDGDALVGHFEAGGIAAFDFIGAGEEAITSLIALLRTT